MTLTASDSISSSFAPSSMPARRSFASLVASKRVDSDWSVPAYTQSAEVVAEENDRDLKIDLLMAQLERHLSNASCYSTDDSCGSEEDSASCASAHSEADEEEECKESDAVVEEAVECLECSSIQYDEEWDSCRTSEEDDDESADLFDACVADLYSVSSLGEYSRKAQRLASKTSSVASSGRLSTSSLRTLRSSRGALSAACTKASPVTTLREDKKLSRSTDLSGPTAPIGNAAISPYADEQSRAQRCLRLAKARKEIAEREAAKKKEQMKQLAASLPSSSAGSPAAPAVSTTPAAPSVPKSLARACASAARKLPQVLQECSNPRWQAVLQQRAASKAALNAAKASRPERAGRGSRSAKEVPTPSQTVTRQTNKERKEAAVALRNEQARVASELKALRQLSKSKATPKVAPLAASTIIQSTTAARWTAAHPALAAASTTPSAPTDASSDAPSAVSKPHARLPSKSKAHFQLKASQRAAAAIKALDTPARRLDLEPLPSVDESARLRRQQDKLSQQKKTRSAANSSAFDKFRRDWYQLHRHHLERPFGSSGTALRIRLSDPAPHVQEAFLNKLNEAGGPSAAARNTIATFHGTAAANIPSILNHGFVRPGKQVGGDGTTPGRRIPVANGSSYGVGVYSSTTADFSIGYCRGASSMFICAVITAGSVGTTGPHVTTHNNIIVSFSEAHIVPLFLLDFATGHGAAAPVAVSISAAAAAARNREKRAGEQQARADERRIRERMTQAPGKDMLRQMLREMHSRMLRSART